MFSRSIEKFESLSLMNSNDVSLGTIRVAWKFSGYNKSNFILGAVGKIGTHIGQRRAATGFLLKLT